MKARRMFLKKSSDASSRFDISKSSLKQEDSLEKWGKKCLSNEELDKLLSKHLKRTPEKGGSVIPSLLSLHDKSVTRTDSQNLKEMAPAKRLAIQGATLMLKQAKRTGKNFEASLTKMGCELVVFDSDDVSFFTAICTMFPQLCDADSTNPALDLKLKVTSFITQNEDKFIKVNFL